MVTGSVFGNLYEEKKYNIYTWKIVCHPDCPTESSSHFWHVFVSFYHSVVVVTVLKKYSDFMP